MESQANTSLTFPKDLDDLIDHIREGLLVLEPDLSVRRANRSFCNMFGVTRGEVEGMSLREHCEGQWHQPLLWRRLTTIQAGDDRNFEIDIEMNFPAEKARVISVHGRALDRLPRIFLEVRDVTHEHRHDNDHELLIRELHRRMKTLLYRVQAIPAVPFCDTPSLKECGHTYLRRLAALGRVHDMLTGGDNDLAGADDIIRAELAVYRRPAGFRGSVDGEPVRMSRPEAQTLALIVHEMAANSAMHGAFTQPGGQVDVSWLANLRAGRKHFLFEWRETGVSIDPPPGERGSGLELIEHSVERILGGTVDFCCEPAGISWTVCFPLHTGEEESASAHRPDFAPDGHPQSGAAGFS